MEGWRQGAPYLSGGADGAASQQRLGVALRLLAASDHQRPQGDRLWCRCRWCHVRLGYGPVRRQAESQAADGEQEAASRGAAAAPTARRSENHRQKGSGGVVARAQKCRGREGEKKRYIERGRFLVVDAPWTRGSLGRQRRENGSCARSEFKSNALAEEAGQENRKERASLFRPNQPWKSSAVPDRKRSKRKSKETN